MFTSIIFAHLRVVLKMAAEYKSNPPLPLVILVGTFTDFSNVKTFNFFIGGPLLHWIK